ncbi:MAG: GDSL-type esterase/lipase family protein [Xanthobacteraceae bacterium]
MMAVLPAAVAVAALPASRPALAQFWGGYQQQRQQPFFNPFRNFFGPNQGYPNNNYGDRYQDGRSQPQADYSHAPPPSPRKPEAQPGQGGPAAPTTTVAVLGDSMADWLAYGLEDAFSDTPEVTILRKNKPASGLIRYDTRVETDWAKVTREILAADKPNYVVMMLGVNDRQPLRERAAPVKPGAPAGQPQPKDAGAPQAKDPRDLKEAKDPKEQKDSTEQPAAPPAQDAEAPADGADQSATAQKGQQQGRSVSYEFHTEKWEELYGKLIDETIAALKSKGVPVFWVALPAIRGTKAISDVSYLNSLYKAHAEKAGVVYVDVWDGFVDEGGHFALQGPDFEGQTRRLRAPDGVHFTKPGALKLAHYVEHEIRRLMQSRVAPMAIPLPEDIPQTAPSSARPGEEPARPVAGPVVPLTTFSGGSEELIGGRGRAVTAPNTDATVTRVLVKGEPVSGPQGRADDFAWPRPTASATDVIEIPVATALRPPPRPPVQSGQSGGRAQAAPAAPAGQVAQSDAKGQAARPAREPHAERPGNDSRNGGPPRPPMAIGHSAPPPREGLLGGRF